MSESSDDIARAAAEIRELHAARVQAELKAADAVAPGSDRISSRGALLAEAVFVKGLPGPSEASGGTAFSGADGEAAVKAAEALGYASGEVFFTLSRPDPQMPAALAAERLRFVLEAVDPSLVVACDSQAADDLAAAMDCARPPFGEALRVRGRRLVAVDGLEASLNDTQLKRRVWTQLQAGRREGPVY